MQSNKMIKQIGAMAMMFLIAGHAMAQDSTKKIYQFSLQQALDYAKQHSVQVQNALLDIRIQHQVNRDVTSIALPQINASGNVTDYLDIPTTLVPGEFAGGAPGTFFPVKFGTKWTSSAGVNLHQMLFDGQVFIALKARNGTMELARKREEITEENIRTNVYKIYYQLVSAKAQQQLLNDVIDRVKKFHHDVTVAYDNGFREQLDIDKINVQLANLETDKLNLDNGVMNGYTGLKMLMGMPVKDSLVLTDAITDDQVTEGALEASQFKYTDRRDYQLMDITNKLNKLNVRRFKLSQYPTLALVGNYSKQAQRNEFNFFNKGSWFTTSYLGLQLNLPLFNGFAARARTAKARLELQQTLNYAEAMKNSIDGEINNAKNNYATAIAAVNAQKKNMTLASNVYDRTKKKYDMGTGSTSEVNDALLDMQTAQANYSNALYQAIIAKVDFLKATGKL